MEILRWLQLLYVAAVAAVWGSFFNVLLHRLPRREPVAGSARSRCPSCGHTLGAADLVPVLSYLLLGGRCRYCRRPIHWRYPAVELACAAGAALGFWALGWQAAAAGFGHRGWAGAAVGLALASLAVWLADRGGRGRAPSGRGDEQAAAGRQHGDGQRGESLVSVLGALALTGVLMAMLSGYTASVASSERPWRESTALTLARQELERLRHTVRSAANTSASDLRPERTRLEALSSNDTGGVFIPIVPGAGEPASYGSYHLRVAVEPVAMPAGGLADDQPALRRVTVAVRHASFPDDVAELTTLLSWEGGPSTWP